MCMYIDKTAEFKKAEEDIVVYKFMRKKSCFFGLISYYETPYMKTRMLFLRNGSVLKAKGKVNKIYHYKGMYEINGGVIHTFRLKPTKEVYDCFECVIPKGTAYINDACGNEIGAKKIKFIKRIKD